MTSHFGHFIIDPIKTDAGYVAGTMMGDIGKEVRIYRGIPYAAPPVGDLRWKPPQPVTPWTGIRECTKFSLYGPRKHFQPSPCMAVLTEAEMSEDCLYLNVLTPAKKTTDRLPVMVWFHGGGLTRCGGNSSLYNLSIPAPAWCSVSNRHPSTGSRSVTWLTPYLPRNHLIMLLEITAN